MDAFKSSLNAVNDRLRIEESYLDGAKDVLIKLKQLTLQGANASMSGRDKEVLALQVDELIAEIKNWLTALMQTGTTSLLGLG